MRAGVVREAGSTVCVGMALYGDLTYDSRVRKEARALAEAGFEVVLACLRGDPEGPDLPAGVTVRQVPAVNESVVPGSSNPFRARGTRRASAAVRGAAWLVGYVRNLRTWGRSAIDACGPVRLWYVHDLTGLAAIAPAVDSAVPIVYDSHELFMESGTAIHLPGPARAFLRRYEARLVARCAAVVTVNDALATVLRDRYRPRRVVVVHNCPDRWTRPDVVPDVLRRAAGIPAECPVILHHGVLAAERGIEVLMDAILEPGLDQAHLVLLGYGTQRERYRQVAADSRWQGRVHVLDAVPPSGLLDWVACADVGAMPILGATRNHVLSTPNKMFECLAAGVPVVASDFPMMRKVLLGEPTGALGEVCDPHSVAETATAIRAILELDPPARDALRRRCLAAAHDHWNWETESSKLVTLCCELAGAPPPTAATG